MKLSPDEIWYLSDNCTSNRQPNVDELTEDETKGRALQVDEGQEYADHDVGKHRAHASTENDATYLETYTIILRLMSH